MAEIVSCEKGRHVEGTPLLRWSTVPMCRKFVVGEGRKASRVSTSAPLFVTFPELTSGRFAVPLLRPTILKIEALRLDLQLFGHKS